MKFLITALFLASFSYTYAGTWTQISDSVIRFDGNIEEGEYQKFSAVFSSNIQEIIVNSLGGLTSEGLKIGQVIAEKKIKVTVLGVCLSSCANYLFTSASIRKISRGIVGYHGNVKACFTSQKAIDDVKTNFLMANPNATQEQIDKILKQYSDYIAPQVKSESELLKRVSVSQELFDRACTPDKGLQNGQVYNFLLPSPTTFEKYGIQNVEGQQDPDMAKSYLSVID